MCLECHDADKRAELIKKGICNGIDLILMTTEELKNCLADRWLKEGKTSFRIIKEAITDRVGDSLSWTISNKMLNGKSQSAKISVQFV